MNLNGKNILIVGGAGFIGSHLTDQLSGQCCVRVLDDFSTGSRDNLRNHLGDDGIEIIDGDVSVAAIREQAMAGINVVFHLACRNVRHSIGHPRNNHDVNATATLDLLREARRCDVERFVYVSSSEVYGTAQKVPMNEQHRCFPETVYGASKLAGEAYTRAFFRTYSLPTVVVRPFNNFGPRSHFEGDSGEVIPRFIAWALNKRQPTIFGDGEQTRDFIYVEETAHWLKQAAECDSLVGQTINLGSGAETSVNQLAEMIYEETGCADIKPRHESPRPGDVARHCADASLARRLLGFELRIGVREGIRRLLEHLTNRVDDPRELLKSIGQQNWQAEEG